MEKTIKVTVEQAKELYKQNPKFRKTILSNFTDEELEILPKLKDWKKSFNNEKVYYYIDEVSKIENIEISSLSIGYREYNLVSTEKHAISMLAFSQLSILMEDLREECNIDWSDGNKPKYCITREFNSLSSTVKYRAYHFLTFKTEKVRDAFLEKHRKLIEEYFMI